MKKLLQEMTTDELIDYINNKDIVNVYERSEINKAEKILKARLEQSSHESLKDIHSSLMSIKDRLFGFNTGIAQLKEVIGDTVESSKRLARSNEEYFEKLKFWLLILLGAVILLTFLGFRQVKLFENYTKETQRFVEVAQAQLDFQMQPVLILEVSRPFGNARGFVSLKNIGNGEALNIDIKPKEGNMSFTHVPDMLETDVSKPLHKKPYPFGAAEDLIIMINYENINNKKYFTKAKIVKDKAYIVERGVVPEGGKKS